MQMQNIRLYFALKNSLSKSSRLFL